MFCSQIILKIVKFLVIRSMEEKSDKPIENNLQRTICDQHCFGELAPQL